MLQRMRVMWFL